MNFILSPPSLEHRTSVKIAITLWSKDDDFRRFLATSVDFLKDNWQDIEKLVEENASKLSLPKLLKKRLLDNIRPVGLQILSWIEFHEHKKNRFINEWPTARFFWTPHGTIDNMRTAEVLVKDGNLSVELRFKLACFYCLGEDISDLKEKYCSIGRIDNIFILFWLNYLNANDDIYRTQLTRCCARQFVVHGSESAIKFLFLKIGTQNGKLLVSTARYVVDLIMDNASRHLLNAHCAILCFLLSIMNVEQQTEIFKSSIYGVLKCFLIWPRQSLFLEAVEGKWNFISKNDYFFLLHDIIDRMSLKQNNFSELFGEFWQQTPEKYKQFLVRLNRIESLLLKLRKIDDKNNIELIMKYSSIHH